jgi:putative ABC transport system permease protein
VLSNYLKIAIKVLLRRKFYTFVSLFGIAFTLTILMLATAMLDNVVFQNPPESKLDRTLTIDIVRMAGPTITTTSDPGYGLLDLFARDLPGAENLSIVSDPEKVASFLDGRKVESYLRRTDGAFWEIMDFEFLEGGPYTTEDDRRGNFVAVINETTRERFFGGEDAVGRTLRAEGQAFTVVGVVRDIPFVRMSCFSEIWVPIGTSRSSAYRESWIGGFSGIILAQDRAKIPQIKEEYQSRIAAAELPDPELFETVQSIACTRFEQIARDLVDDPWGSAATGKFTVLLGVLAVLFMLLPVLNLVNLSLSRILERSSEIGVRKAFGASSWTLVGQFLVESVVLTVIGGAVGLVLSALALQVLRNADFVPYGELSLNFRVFFYGLGLALVFGILSGAYPAWRMSRLHPVEALHGRTR